MELSDKLTDHGTSNHYPDFDGDFYMGVKTTGIFCKSTCLVSKPKAVNIETFQIAKDALLKGYRPCAVCKPLQNLDETPVFILEVLDELTENPSLILKNADLVERGIDVKMIKLWFHQNYGMTFQAFQGILRLNTASKKIQLGENLMDAAYDSGFENLSGFDESFKNVFGVLSENSKDQKIIDLKRIETPIGPMYSAAVEEGICMLEYSDRKSLENEFWDLAKTFNAKIVIGENQHFRTLEKQLSEYFGGQRTAFTVPLSPVGTEFQKSVWNTLIQIPYGETWTYRKQSENLGDARKVRAVANANGLNKISIIIPCHRVIGSNGTLTGYGGGIWRKQKLLELEKAILF